MKTLAHDEPDVQSTDTFPPEENDFERAGVTMNRMFTNLALRGDMLYLNEENHDR